jgi:hypothetical protein
MHLFLQANVAQTKVFSHLFGKKQSLVILGKHAGKRNNIQGFIE